MYVKVHELGEMGYWATGMLSRSCEEKVHLSREQFQLGEIKIMSFCTFTIYVCVVKVQEARERQLLEEEEGRRILVTMQNSWKYIRCTM